jgi:AraC-like DNA-binding protein
MYPPPPGEASLDTLHGRIRSSTHCSAHGSWRVDRLRPAAALAGLVTVTNAYSEQDTGFTRRRELPDGNATILFNLGDPVRIEHPDGSRAVFAPGTAFYSGPSPSYAVSETDRAQQGAQVMLTLLGARRLLGIPLAAVGDALTDPALLLGSTMRDTLARLQDAQSHTQRLIILDQAITTRLLAADSAPPADITWALNRLRATRGRITVRRLAEDIGCSRKHLTTRFTHEFGLPPKVLSRVLRFAHAMAHLRAGQAESWAAIAAACGYADQSHLAREFHALAGAAPRTLATHALPDDGGFTD